MPLRTLSLMRGSFSARKISRKYPVLAGFHRGIDGGLIGVLFCAALMSAVTLHSQYLWTRSFSKLEITRDLTHRLEESIANLERYLLNSVTLPNTMVETKSSDLLYIPSPPVNRRTLSTSSVAVDYINRLSSSPIIHGY
ncbi:hypothetical protein EV05_0546 [Prochlorococcus sp. MIT 0601]|nr:hypothetical protein EV05_0546 [Prochlorococcus sp. MIT 0601]